MGIFGAIAKAFNEGAKEINKDFGKNNDFLLGVTAACALVIFADGTAEDSEKEMAMKVLTGHSQLSKLYTPADIKKEFSDALDHAQTNSGRGELRKSLDRIQGMQNAGDLCEGVFLVAVDCAQSNSRHTIGPDEQMALDSIAKHLSVDISKLEI